MLHLLAEAAPATSPLWSVDSLVSLLTLTILEIVLGIDNIVFIAILCARLPENQRAKARRLGLVMALVTRVAFVCLVVYIMKLAKVELFTIGFLTEVTHSVDGDKRGPMVITGKDVILILGGLFLLWKAVHEIHGKIEGPKEIDPSAKKKAVSFNGIITQILLIDVVFSIDSVITAVGMAQHIPIMVAAVIISVGIMMLAAGPISAFIDRHPTMKILALSFLMLIGFLLVAEGFGQHIPKGYIYFAMTFSLLVEIVNIKIRARPLLKPVEADSATLVPPASQ
jgi:predicted tellurium resistance membrane protein TerC